MRLCDVLGPFYIRVLHLCPDDDRLSGGQVLQWEEQVQAGRPEGFRARFGEGARVGQINLGVESLRRMLAGQINFSQRA